MIPPEDSALTAGSQRRRADHLSYNKQWQLEGMFTALCGIFGTKPINAPIGSNGIQNIIQYLLSLWSGNIVAILGEPDRRLNDVYHDRFAEYGGACGIMNISSDFTRVEGEVGASVK